MRIALVTEYDPAAMEEEDQPGLRNPLLSMIERFCKRFPGECEIVNLHEFPFAGGCLGCYHCTLNGKCIYKDGFEDFLREHINSADAIVFAFTIKDHSMGYRFKIYDDRQFCNGHRTVTMGKPVGYIVDGDLQVEENLRMVISARAEVGGNFLAGIATDMEDTDREVDQLAQRLTYAIEHNYVPPKNFYGVGGLKIFRDLIYQMRGMMRADHKFYKKQGIYDFPQKKKLTSLKMYLVGALLSNEKILAKMGNKMNEGMLMPYEKMFQKMQQKKK
jgi:multimeric flavodoxin WrbA